MRFTPLFWAGVFAFVAGFLQAHKDLWPEILRSYDDDTPTDDEE